MKESLQGINKEYDVEIIEVGSLEEEYAEAFEKEWAIHFADATTIQFDTEDEACAAQRAHRKTIGLDPITGEKL